MIISVIIRLLCSVVIMGVGVGMSPVSSSLPTGCVSGAAPSDSALPASVSPAAQAYCSAGGHLKSGRSARQPLNTGLTAVTSRRDTSQTVTTGENGSRNHTQGYMITETTTEEKKKVPSYKIK